MVIVSDSRVIGISRVRVDTYVRILIYSVLSTRDFTQRTVDVPWTSQQASDVLDLMGDGKERCVRYIPSIPKPRNTPNTLHFPPY